MKNKVDKNLSRMKIKPLTKEERDYVWQRVVTAAHQPLPTSHFMIAKLIRKPLTWGVMIAVFILAGSVATVSAANNAKPGDFLFSIDRAIESIQLSLASDQQKTELKLQMVQERLEEIQAILAETDTKEEQDSNDTDDNNQENDDEDEESENTEDAQENTTTGEEENETEEEPSKDQQRVEQAFAFTLDFIADIKEELAADNNTDAIAAIDLVIGELDTEIEELPDKWKFQIKKSKDTFQLKLDIKTPEGKQSIKIKQNGDKIDIDQKNEDGKIKVKIKDAGSVKVKDKKKGKDKDDDDEEEEDEDEDTTAPVIEIFSPENNATEIALDTNLIMTFSEDVVASSGTIVIKKAINDSTVETIDAASTTGTNTNIITVNPTANLVSNTEYYVQIDAGAFEDTAGNAYEGISDTATWSFTTVDTIAPVISAISSDATASTTATIAWTTDETAESTISYGTTTPVTTNFPFILVSDTDLLLNHSIDITDLTAGTTYNFIVISKDIAGNEAISDEDSFTTPAL